MQYWIISIVFTVLIFIIAQLPSSLHSSGITIMFMIIFMIPLIIVSIGRWHDLGLSGWLVLLLIIPYIGLISSIPLAFLKGDEEDNKYGPNPYKKSK